MSLTQATTEQALSLTALAQVERAVRRFLGPAFDHESLASDILLESWTKGHPKPALSFIRLRCLDALRSHRLEQSAMHEHASSIVQASPTDDAEAEIELSVEIDTLLRPLDNSERKLIALRFWMNLTMAECAKRLEVNTSVAKLMLLRAIEKMKEAV